MRLVIIRHDAGLAAPMVMIKYALAMLTVLLLVSACAATASAPIDSAAPAAPLSKVKPLTDPRSYVGASTARLESRDVQPIEITEAPQLPTTVTSHDPDGERKVTVTDTSRVIAMDLSGSLAATVWALGQGDQLVGRDISSEFPGTEQLPIVTRDGHSINAEAVIALRPTLVITDDSIGPRDVITQLREVGITVVFVDNVPSFDGAAGLATQVAASFGIPAAGKALAKQLTTQISDTRAAVATLAPKDPQQRLRMVFLYLRGNAGVYYLLGQEAGANELITALGGVAVAEELGWAELVPLTDEAMVAADPDLILVMTKGLDSVGGIAGLEASRPAIGLTKAGQHDRFVDMADGDVLSFGPRSAQVLEALARAVYAPPGS